MVDDDLAGSVGPGRPGRRRLVEQRPGVVPTGERDRVAGLAAGVVPGVAEAFEDLVGAEEVVTEAALHLLAGVQAPDPLPFLARVDVGYGHDGVVLHRDREDVSKLLVVHAPTGPQPTQVPLPDRSGHPLRSC